MRQDFNSLIVQTLTELVEPLVRPHQRLEVYVGGIAVSVNNEYPPLIRAFVMSRTIDVFDADDDMRSYNLGAPDCLEQVLAHVTGSLDDGVV